MGTMVSLKLRSKKSINKNSEPNFLYKFSSKTFSSTTAICKVFSATWKITFTLFHLGEYSAWKEVGKRPQKDELILITGHFATRIRHELWFQFDTLQTLEIPIIENNNVI